MDQSTDIMQAMQQANEMAYLAGRYDQLARGFVEIDRLETAAYCARQKRRCQQVAEKIIEGLPIVAA